MFKQAKIAIISIIIDIIILAISYIFMISKTGAISGKKNGEDEIGLVGFALILKFSESVVVLIFGDIPIYILTIVAIIIFAIVLIIRN